MVRSRANSVRNCGTHYDRNASLATEHVATLRRLIRDLIHRGVEKWRERAFYDRSHAGQRGTDPDTEEPGLANRRIANSLRTELLHGVGIQVHPDVLSHHEHARIGAHFLDDGSLPCISVRQSG